MSDRLSLADRAVHALASVSAMGQSVASDAPERFLIWNLQETARAILSEAFCRAEALAFVALDAEKLAKELKEQAK